METLHIFRLPIEPRMLAAVGQLLRSRAVFSPTFDVPEIDLYDPAVYLAQAAEHSTQTHLLLDRNVLSRIVAIARGERVTRDHRFAAAILAFAQCADIQIEPHIALYELGSQRGQAAAADELAWFRRANETHPGHWAEIAVGLESELGELHETHEESEGDRTADFTMPLRRWNRNYILCLKLAQLELSSGSAKERFRTFLRWSFDEFMLGGPAIGLAAHYLAPNAQKSGLLKSLRSPDRAKALKGIKNAAWDLTLVSEWLGYIATQEATGRLVLLTSFDRAVHKLAQSVAAFTTAGEAYSPARTLECLWGEELGAELNREIEALYASRENPSRRLNGEPEGFSIQELIRAGEQVILEWSNSRSRPSD